MRMALAGKPITTLQRRRRNSLPLLTGEPTMTTPKIRKQTGKPRTSEGRTRLRRNTPNEGTAMSKKM